jgi:hypothetical protein
MIEEKQYRFVDSLPASNLSINDSLLRKARFFPIPAGKPRSLSNARLRILLQKKEEE